MGLLDNALLDRYVVSQRRIGDDRFYEERRRLIGKTVLVHVALLNLYALTWRKRNYRHFWFTTLGVATGTLNSFKYTNDLIVEYTAKEEMARRDAGLNQSN